MSKNLKSYGHYKNHPSQFRVGDWRDEFRASYCAALNALNCPRCGNEIIYKKRGNSIAVECKTKDCIYGGIRGF